MSREPSLLPVQISHFWHKVYHLSARAAAIAAVRNSAREREVLLTHWSRKRQIEKCQQHYHALRTDNEILSNETV